MPITAYIGFGSNLGDLLGNLEKASQYLAAHPEITLKKLSKLYETEPLKKEHDEKHPWYLNCVMEIETNLTLHKLFQALKNTEKTMGRRTRSRWQPRNVDLDILFFGNVIYEDKELHIPHRSLTERNFVLKPLCDLIPDFIHPEFNMTLQNIFASSQDLLQVRELNNTGIT